MKKEQKIFVWAETTVNSGHKTPPQWQQISNAAGAASLLLETAPQADLPMMLGWIEKKVLGEGNEGLGDQLEQQNQPSSLSSFRLKPFLLQASPQDSMLFLIWFSASTSTAAAGRLPNGHHESIPKKTEYKAGGQMKGSSASQWGPTWSKVDTQNQKTACKSEGCNPAFFIFYHFFLIQRTLKDYL